MTESLNSNARSVARNAVSGYGVLMLSTLLALFTTPLLLHGLGEVQFGLWAVVLSAVGYIGLLEAGLGTTTITRIASEESAGPEVISRIASSSRAVYYLSIVLMVPVGIGLALLLPGAASAPQDLRDHVRTAVLLAVAVQAMTLLTNTYAAVLIGTGRAYVLTLSGFAVGTAVVLAQVGAAVSGLGLEGLALVAVLGAAASFLVQRHQVRRLVPLVRVKRQHVDRDTVRHLVGLGWRNALASLTGGLAFGSDVLIVGLFLSPRVAASYAVAQRIANLLKTLTTKIADVMQPTFSHAGANRDRDAQFQLYANGVCAGLLVAVPGALVCAVFGGELLDLWLQEAPRDSGRVLALLAVVVLLQLPGHTAFVMLQGMERLQVLNRVLSVAAVVNVAASLIFLHWFGVLGPALGSLIAVPLFDTLVLPRLVCRELRQPYSRYFREVLLPVAPVCLFTAAVAVLLRVLLRPQPLPALFLCSGLTLVFWGGWWSVVATAHQRMRIKGLIRRGST